ncbi:U-box domain-containing protein 3-like [Vicia villosa]|uniref:U-box domain-containing protein 3-like n=1 Tax=Vicia villosa TaxID=3911 RepID=UPI00273CA191|nr:U-box domain-containing protein 3-like [Vicia villosa]
MHIGQTKTASVKCLINSISRFVLLVSCQTVKPIPFQKICNNMVGVLKRLKPVLDDIMDYNIPLHENLCIVCEELDILVNEARGFIEKWSPKMSKIHSVLQSGTLLIKIQNTSLDICHMIVKSLQSPPSASVLANLQHYIEEIQCLKKEAAMVFIEKELGNRNIEPCNENLKEIIELLNLTSNQELLKETIAVEKERLNAEEQKMKGNMEEINEVVNLVRNLRDYVVKTECFAVESDVSFPPYFRCPLSLELMLDPVIVASGQTYERKSIQMWLDNGLTVCPKTRQRLTHTNLIPNYTVKAMIATWSEENNTNRLSNSEHNHNTGNVFEEQKADNSFGSHVEIEKWELQSPYIHSRSESFSSSISSSDCLLAVSKDVSRMSDKHQNVKVSSIDLGAMENGRNSTSNTTNSYSRVDSHLVPNSGSSELTTSSHVNTLIKDLQSQSAEAQTAAAEELRLLTKHNTENRIIVGQCGAVTHLLSLLYSNGKVTQEHAVTALLNLSINEDNKALIMEAGAIEPLIHVLKTGNDGAKENSAAALFSLSVMENGKVKIGRSGAVKALVELLASGTLRGKKDAATALYNLSIFHDNKARIVLAGAVPFLVRLTDPADGMVDKAVALLSNLSTIPEGRLEIAREGGIPSLVEIVESGSQRGKENAASILLQLCLHSSRFCTLVLQEGAVPPLVALSQSGTPRAKEKAQQLLSHFRNQREGAKTKGKS